MGDSSNSSNTAIIALVVIVILAVMLFFVFFPAGIDKTVIESESIKEKVVPNAEPQEVELPDPVNFNPDGEGN